MVKSYKTSILKSSTFTTRFLRQPNVFEVPARKIDPMHVPLVLIMFHSLTPPSNFALTLTMGNHEYYFRMMFKVSELIEI